MEVFQPIAIALGLGLLVGLQREWSAPHVAGLRTFAFITVFGAVSALLAQELGAWIIASGFLALTAMIIVASLMKFRREEIDPGLTTATAALLMYGVGAALVLGHTAHAIAVGGVVAVLLHWKEPLHHVVERFGEKDIRAIIQLVLIGLVVLPLLPNRAYDPYEVLNPFKIWLLVVLIVGISVGGYIIYKFVGAKAGTMLGGLLGGIISSTATTVGYARHSRNAPQTAPLASLVLMIASTVVFARVLFEVGVVAPSVLPDIAPPLIAMMLFMAAVSVVLFFLVRNKTDHDAPPPEDPSQIKAAIVFGALYALVIFCVAAVKEHLGDEALYLVAAISGLTDMDAITLSTAQFIENGDIEVGTGWRLILVGGMTNLVFKGGVVAALGAGRLFGRIAILFGISLAGGAALLFFWP